MLNTAHVPYNRNIWVNGKIRLIKNCQYLQLSGSDAPDSELIRQNGLFARFMIIMIRRCIPQLFYLLILTYIQV